MLTIEESRKYFPYLKTGKKYFNHAAISPMSSIVKEKLVEYLNIRSETDIEPYFKTLPQANGAKDKLANLINVKPSEIAWSSNVSDSLNVLAQGLKWNHGDEIILNNIEFPSNIYPFLNLKKKGVNVLFAKAEEGIIDLPQLEKLISPRTKLISISLVQFLTGYRANLKEIGELCKKNNIIFCVDGIQGVGAVNIDVIDCNIDFFAGGSHKWLMGLQGLGYFYLSPRISDQIDQKNIGWTSVKNPWNLLDYNIELLENAEKFQNGTLPRIAIIALNASLSLLERYGYEKVEKQILDNSTYLIEQLKENGFKPILENVKRNNLSGIVSFYHDSSENVVLELEKKNIVCSVREGLIRVAPHFYNIKDEFDFLVSELKIISI